MHEGYDDALKGWIKQRNRIQRLCNCCDFAVRSKVTKSGDAVDEISSVRMLASHLP